MSSADKNIWSALELISKYAGKHFALWVIIVALLALTPPLRLPFARCVPAITPLLGVIMLGIGLTLTFDDFKRIWTIKPRDIVLGAIAQYAIMPFVAYGISLLFGLPPAICAGIVLCGSCPGGTASNVITYLGKGDVAYSVSMTIFSTLLAPIMTPLLVLLLASRWVPVNAIAMFISIVEVVILPIVLGLLIRKYAEPYVIKSLKILPLVSVVAIIIIVAAVVAVSANKILTTGLLVYAAVVVHNLLGYLGGFGIGKAANMPEKKVKAITIEVGMQNSGLAVALATLYFGPFAALPPAIFSVWHNISGPILATFFARKSSS